MHRLVRTIRFSVNPFLDEQVVGYNSYAGKPCGDGLSQFFELTIGLVGMAELRTGFVINVTDIDKAVRENAVPIFSQYISQQYKQQKHVTLNNLVDLLINTKDVLKDKFTPAMLIELGLAVNPYRKIAFDCEDMKMFYYSEKFDFAAMHKLWNDELSEENNFELFGKCANPNGHGHNYIVEITIKAKTDHEMQIGAFEKIVDNELICLVDHKNLNIDVEQLKDINPTIENISAFAWERLNDKFPAAKLHSISIWESDRTFCTYYG